MHCAALASAKELGQAYTRAPGSISGSIHTTHLLSPAGHFLFGALGPSMMMAVARLLHAHLPHPADTTAKAHDKAHRENGFIYFHKVPAGPPEAPEAKCLTVVGKLLVWLLHARVHRGCLDSPHHLKSLQQQMAGMGRRGMPPRYPSPLRLDQLLSMT